MRYSANARVVCISWSKERGGGFDSTGSTPSGRVDPGRNFVLEVFCPPPRLPGALLKRGRLKKSIQSCLKFHWRHSESSKEATISATPRGLYQPSSLISLRKETKGRF